MKTGTPSRMRAPADRPSWLRTVTLSLPSGRTAEEVVIDNAAGLLWAVNLGCIELHTDREAPLTTKAATARRRQQDRQDPRPASTDRVGSP
jgi:DNA primase